MISFAGIYLSVPTPQLVEWGRKFLNPADIFEFADPSGLPFPTQPRRPSHQRIELGRLEWPTMATRWATAHFLATTQQLNGIRAALDVLGGISAPLVLASLANNPISVIMSMLPPRPISQLPGGLNLNLLTLVDDRYYWWERRGELASPATWADAYNTLAGVIGHSILFDTIPAAYLAPPSGIFSDYASVPPLMDMVAFMVGQRIVRLLDGTVIAQNGLNGASVEDDLINESLAKCAGGFFDLRD